MITAITSPDVGRSRVYGYDGLDRLISADNQNGTADDATYAYDDADNMVFNSKLCAANPNLVYPAQGVASGHPHAPNSTCGTSFGGLMIHWSSGDTSLNRTLNKNNSFHRLRQWRNFILQL